MKRGDLRIKTDHIRRDRIQVRSRLPKLHDVGVTFLQQAYAVGEYRAVMIEDPSREAIELIEIANSPNP